MLVEYKQSPTADEARFIREAQWIVGLSKGPGWACVKQEMERMVQQCRDLSEGCVSNDKDVRYGLALRLQMTKAVVNDIIQWVDNTERRYKKLVGELTEGPNIEEEIQRIGDMFATKDEDEHSTANY